MLYSSTISYVPDIGIYPVTVSCAGAARFIVLKRSCLPVARSIARFAQDGPWTLRHVGGSKPFNPGCAAWDIMEDRVFAGWEDAHLPGFGAQMTCLLRLMTTKAFDAGLRNKFSRVGVGDCILLGWI